MKLTIEIDDLNNRQVCVEAVARLYEALVEYQGGESGAAVIFLEAQTEPFPYKRACMSVPNDDLRLVLEYYAMAKPSKRGLAVELAKRNKTLPEEQRFYRGSQEPDTMLQQIKRVFREYKKECAEIGEAPTVWINDELRHVTRVCIALRADDPSRRERRDVYLQISKAVRDRLKKMGRDIS